MIKNIDVRFFCYASNIDDDIETDIYEITEKCFRDWAASDVNAKITYERHTVFDNGVKQICLTIEPSLYPLPDELDLI
jgi:hypothetical protein